MARYVYLVRHGECQANAEGVIAGGQDDSPLTKHGQEQAKETANKLQGAGIDLIVSSPLSRAKDTAQIIAKDLGLNENSVVVRQEFTEKDVGEFSGKPKEEYYAFEKTGAEIGETTTDMQARVRLGLSWLKSQDFKNTLVVSHNGTTRIIRTILEGRPPKDFAFIPHLANGEYFKFDLDEVKI